MSNVETIFFFLVVVPLRLSSTLRGLDYKYTKSMWKQYYSREIVSKWSVTPGDFNIKTWKNLEIF